MAKKLNKVFLNPTAEQIEEYELIEGISWFTDMDAIAAAIEEDQKKSNWEKIRLGQKLTAKDLEAVKYSGQASVRNGELRIQGTSYGETYLPVKVKPGSVYLFRVQLR